jgi:hypothetical protein
VAVPSGERAPHKPLLLLYAPGRYQADARTSATCSTARTCVLSLADQPATPPLALYSHPEPEYITWHKHQVFKHPARKSVPVG